MVQQKGSKGTYYANGVKAHANPFMSDRVRRNKTNDGQLTPLGQLSRAPSQLIPQANGNGDPNHSQSGHREDRGSGNGRDPGAHHPRLVILPPPNLMSTTIMIQSSNNTHDSQAHLLLASGTSNPGNITSNGMMSMQSAAMLLPNALMSISGNSGNGGSGNNTLGYAANNNSGLSLSKQPMLTKTASAPPTPSTDDGHLHPHNFPLPNTVGGSSNYTEPEPSASAQMTDRQPFV
jgi:hypothetical protein